MSWINNQKKMNITKAENILKRAYEYQDQITLSKADISQIKVAQGKVQKYYRDNPDKFIEKHVKIIHHKTNELAPFIMNEAQSRVMKLFKKKDWLALPKARQLGMTTLTNALALHHALFNTNAFVLCMAVKMDNAAENLSRIRTMFSTIPPWLQECLLHFDSNTHVANKNQWTFYSISARTLSTVETATAASEDATRGKQITFWHWTETAFSDVARAVYTSTSPSLQRRTNSKIVMESTGNGATGFYYDVCTGKVDGFDVEFLPWYLDDDYRIEGTLTKNERKAIFKMMEVDLPELADDQLLWYQDKMRNMGISECQQEFPSTIEQVFLSTNASLFRNNVIDMVRLDLPQNFVECDNGHLIIGHGKGKIYAMPDPAKEYLLSIDPSEGILDPAAIAVVDPDGDTVLTWCEKISPDRLPSVVHAIARFYNDALVVCEANGYGQYILNTLSHYHFYPNIFYDEGKMGIRTSVHNKGYMLSLLQEKIVSEALICRGLGLAEEMKTFDAEKLKAMNKEVHDDRVMCNALLAYAFHVQRPRYRRIVDKWNDYNTGSQQKSERNFII